MKLIKSIRNLEYHFDLVAEAFLWHHPLMGFLALFVGIPIFVLFGVCVCTAIITLPIVGLSGLI